jgi:hypothetical protein
MPNFAFGLDFGTSKTAVTLAQTGFINPPVTELAIDGQNSRIATCVLRDKITKRVWIGEQAQQQYQLADAAERERLEFFANFKPHIHQRRKDREAAQQFISRIRQLDGLSHELERHSGDAVVAVGCPVSWDEAGASTLLELLKQARFPPAFAIPEPVGATFHFLGLRLKAQDFRRDIVVFDWGAGTFDMSVLRAGQFEFETTNSWGSTLYGGRLFDDLFYQWLVETAAQRDRQDDVRRLDEQPVDRDIIHGLLCRDIKERFSRHLSTSEIGTRWIYPHQVEIMGDQGINLGKFEVQGIGEFYDRMRAYCPSEIAAEWLQDAQSEARPEEMEFVRALQERRPVDLRAWGRVLIKEGLRNLGIRPMAIVVLTGGSSNWKWFQTDVGAHPLFAERPEACLYDGAPELTIARGLARAYSIGSYSNQLIHEVNAARPLIIEGLRAIHTNVLAEISSKLADTMSNSELRARVYDAFLLALRNAEVARFAEMASPADQSLQAMIKRVVEWLRKLLQGLWAALSTGPPNRSFEDYQNQITRALARLISDPNAEAIRPELERFVAGWLAANRASVSKLDEQVSGRAHRDIMELLRKHVQIGGVVEIAIEACGATGPTSFEDALRNLGSEVEFQPGLISRLYGEASKLIDTLTKGNASQEKEDKTAELEKQADASTERFFAALPEAIRNNVLKAQTVEGWADGVVDDLVRNLRMLARVAGIDTAFDA